MNAFRMAGFNVFLLGSLYCAGRLYESWASTGNFFEPFGFIWWVIASVCLAGMGFGFIWYWYCKRLLAGVEEKVDDKNPVSVKHITECRQDLKAVRTGLVMFVIGVFAVLSPLINLMVFG